MTNCGYNFIEFDNVLNKKNINPVLIVKIYVTSFVDLLYLLLFYP